ncbi:hypothetical protein [Desertibaculum subflavum]|uniref:hypothetical protein n=1 Tax=Desertibaculum subflavum TaxID=2268458 RepID=UPI0013C3EECF
MASTDATAAETHPNRIDPASWFVRWMLGLYLLALFLLLFLAFTCVWYSCDEAISGTPDVRECSLYVLDFRVAVRPTVALALLMALAGGLGSFVHAATSFATYVGNARLDSKWGWWFVVRTPIAMVLALLFYFFLRAGFLGTSTDLNPYGFIATGALVGMFSKQAADKLREVFDTLFRSRGDEQRAGKLSNPVPSIAETTPKELKVGEAKPELKIRGAGFTTASSLEVEGQARKGALKFGDAHHVTATFEPADVAAARSLKIVIANPEPGGGRSDPFTVNVVP